MKNGRIRIVAGWILVAVQMISWIGLNVADMKLWNDAGDGSQYIWAGSSDLNFLEWCTAFEIGNEKFSNSFGNMFVSDEDYIPLTSNEYMSIYIRESLSDNDAGSKVSLFLFDLNILIGYLFYGILGLALLVFGYKANKRSKEVSSALDMIGDKKAKRTRILCIILVGVSIVLQGLTRSVDLTAIGLIFLLIFFVGYIGKKKSVLLSSAVLLVAIQFIWQFFKTIYNVLLMDAETMNFWAFPNAVFAILSLISGIIYLIFGTKLYFGEEKSNIKRLTVFGAVFVTLGAFVWPVSLTIAYDPLFLSGIDLSKVIFAAVIAIYTFKIPCCNGDDTVCAKTEVAETDIAEEQVTDGLE